MIWLNHVEGAFPVASWKVNEIRVWPLIRLQLFGLNFDAMVRKESLVGSWQNKVGTILGSLSSWARAMIADWPNNVAPDRRADVVFLTASYGEQPIIRGKKYNPLLAPYVDLVEQAGKTSLVWEMCPHIQYNTPRFSPSFYIQPYLLLVRVGCYYAPRSRQVLSKSLDGYSDFIGYVSASNLVLRYADLVSLAQDVYFIRYLADRFKVWLERIQPSHGFIIDHWLREHAFCLACRELGITTVEIQHGVQDELHPAYAAWNSVPRGGYETLANIYWCWDESTARTINQWAAHTGACDGVVGGDPWREMWKTAHTDLVKSLDAEIGNVKKRSNATKHILLSLDYTGDVIPKHVLDALCASPFEWCYWVRLHPVDSRSRLPAVIRLLRDNNVRHAGVDYVSQLPLPAILRHVDVQVTVSWSSVIIHAKDFGVPSVACAERAAEIYPQEVNEGTLKIAVTAAQIVESISRQLRTQQVRRNDARPNPAGTMRDLLERGVQAEQLHDLAMSRDVSAI
jgi:hypothetical protein